MTDPFELPLSRHIWESRYRQPGEAGITASWRRVAHALAASDRDNQSFLDALSGFRFLPGGRILAGAGTEQRVTLFNCFVMGVIGDSLDGILDGLKEGALTMQQGGGVGYDFSTLRPRGTRARSVGAVASGPVSFMRIWDSTCATLLSTGARRGAMMATLRCDHPDIEEFVAAKQDPRELRRFNLSVQVFDDFIDAVRRNADWELVFPEPSVGDAGTGETLMRRWTGSDGPVACRVIRRVPARKLWDDMLRATYEYAEPGVLFMDRINRANNLSYREHITATNPCGEIPLPPYGACDLGSVNLAAFVRNPFGARASLDMEGIERTARAGVRMLDRAIDVSRFPLAAQAAQARGTRRVGLGITGLAGALIMLGKHYDSQSGRDLAADVMRRICHAAYRTSIDLARDHGAFPFLEREAYLDAPFIRELPADIRDGIAKDGIRNSHLCAIAPTGTVSLLANNVSSGIEPVYSLCMRRRVVEPDGSHSDHEVNDYAFALWRKLRGAEKPGSAFVDAADLAPEAHLAMQAALQPWVDNSISKTINVPREMPFEDFRRVYDRAFDLGLKGCTTFRPNPVTGAILEEHTAPGVHCCTPEREDD